MVREHFSATGQRRNRLADLADHVFIVIVVVIVIVIADFSVFFAYDYDSDNRFR
jgi:hypothetical protein